MVGFGCFVFAEAASKLINPVLPSAETMGVVGLVALAGNAMCSVCIGIGPAT
jgi:Co/Zn/Cd efflux system component